MFQNAPFRSGEALIVAVMRAQRLEMKGLFSLVVGLMGQRSVRRTSGHYTKHDCLSEGAPYAAMFRGRGTKIHCL
jgi:hypothetical protein